MNEATSNPINENGHETCGVSNSDTDSRNRTVYKAFKVYALCDPRVPTVPRYVGMSSNLTARLSKHRTRPNSFDAKRWIKGLADDGLPPCLIVLGEFTTEDEALKRERELILSLPDLLNGPAQGGPVTVSKTAIIPGESMESLERRHILGVLDRVGGNKLQAARVLGIGRQTLYNKLAKLAG